MKEYVILYVRKLIAYTLVVLSFVCAWVIPDIAEQVRGYYAIGGEFFIPFIIIVIAYLIYPDYEIVED